MLPSVVSRANAPSRAQQVQRDLSSLYPNGMPRTVADYANRLLAGAVQTAPARRSGDVASIQLAVVDHKQVVLIIREKCLEDRTECFTCSGRLDPAVKGCGFAADIIVDGEVLPIDGDYCCEDCAKEGAKATKILDPKGGRHA